MRLSPRLGRIPNGLVLLLGLVAMLMPASAATAQGGNSSLVVHNRICPAEYQGENYFEDCHDTAPDPGLSFTLADGATREGTTNENGNVRFENVPQGTYSITGGVPGEFADLYVYCSEDAAETSNENPVEIEYVTGGIQLDLQPNTDVICDWYNIPLDLQGDPTATQPPAQTPTSEPGGNQFDLPIYTLACESAPDEQAIGEFLTTGPVPEDCEQAAGVGVSIANTNGNVIGTCTTNAQEPCYVEVVVGTTVFGTEDVDALPEGYAPLNDDTIEVTIEPASEASLVFVNVPAEEPTVTQAPSTATTPVEPTTPPTGPTEPVEQGRTLELHAGSCGMDRPGMTVLELQDLRSPDGEPEGQPGAVTAGTSTTSVPQTLDELLANRHSIVAFDETSRDSRSNIVACGEIGGVVNENGELVIGLSEQNGSGFSGIAFLASPDDPAAGTDVSVFLTEEEEAEGTPES